MRIDEERRFGNAAPSPQFGLDALQLLAALFNGSAKTRHFCARILGINAGIMRNEKRVEGPDCVADRDSVRRHSAANNAFSHPFKYSQMQSTAAFSSVPEARTSKV